MMRFLNWMQKEPVGAVTGVDRLLEMVSLVLAVFLPALAVVVYLEVPQQIPVHFTLSGEIDGWGDKGMAFLLAGIGIVAMAICNAAAYNYKMVNLPVRLNPKCLRQQVTLMGRMSRILSVLCGLAFVVGLLLSFAPRWNIQPFCSFLFMLIIIGVMVTIMVYTVLIYKMGRKYR